MLAIVSSHREIAQRTFGHIYQGVLLQISGLGALSKCKVNFFKRSHNDSVRMAVAEITERIAQKTRELVELICRLEENRPFTLNHERYSVLKDLYMTDFIHYRNQTNTSTQVSRLSHTISDRSGNYQSISQNAISEDVLISHLYSKGYKITDPKQLARLHPPDEYEPELTVISGVIAYFEIASKRIVDVVPMMFEVAFVQEVGNELRNSLSYALNLVGDQGAENCARYSRDDEDVHHKRNKWNEDKRILMRALQILRTS